MTATKLVLVSKFEDVIVNIAAVFAAIITFLIFLFRYQGNHFILFFLISLFFILISSFLLFFKISIKIEVGKFFLYSSIFKKTQVSVDDIKYYKVLKASTPDSSISEYILWDELILYRNKNEAIDAFPWLWNETVDLSKHINAQILD